jgi:arylsulfatase A-like enzyme
MHIVYLHSHDTGRHIQPYGHQVPTPNIQRLAEQGVLFRQAFSAAPVCSGSRAALLTGEFPHTNGMLGLAHRGYRLVDYHHHLVHTLRSAGYTSTLIGEQHVAPDPEDIGYDRIVALRSHEASEVAPAAARASPAAGCPTRSCPRSTSSRRSASSSASHAPRGCAGARS